MKKIQFFMCSLAMMSVILLQGCGEEQEAVEVAEEVALTMTNITINTPDVQQPLLAQRCSADDHRDVLYRTNRQFALEWARCSREAWGESTATSSCLKKLFPKISTMCANCFGSYAACTKSNCFWSCSMSTDAACESCAQKECSSQLQECTGLKQNELPTSAP